MATDAERFLALFRGSDRSHGVWDPKTEKMKTAKEPVELALVEWHLIGQQGLGVVPIMDDNHTLWGAIDIDVHGPNAQDVKVEKVDAAIRKHSLPLIACRSKSGGVHCYAFWSELTPATAVQAALKHWAIVLGFPTAEIFPKQSKLPPNALGNWINLPYFNAPATVRYAVIGGKTATLSYFLECAEAAKIVGTPQLAGAGAVGLNMDEAPPCLVALYSEKCAVGERNKAMFQAAVWLKRQHPDEWQTYAQAFNEQGFDRPLTELELKKILGSVEKKTYTYRCKDEPCVSRCQRTLCLTKKFGIRPELDFYAPPIEKILVVNSDPPRYVVKIFDRDVMMESRQLLIPYLFKLRVFEITGELVKVPGKDELWDEFIVSIKDKFEQTESGQGTRDVFLTHFRMIAQDAYTDRQEPDEAKRRVYARDTGPATVQYKGAQMMAFKFAHVEKRLKQQFSMFINTSDLAAYLRTIINAEPRELNIAGKSERLWLVDREALMNEPTPKDLNVKTDY